MNFLPGWFPCIAAAVPKLVSITQVASTSNELTDSITAPAGIIAGDLIVCLNIAESGGAGPTTAVPSGFTSINNVTVTTPGSNVQRSILSYKLAVGTEASSTLTGMVGAYTLIILVFRGNAPAALLTVASVNGQATAGNPTAQSVTASGGVVPLVVLGAYWTQGVVNPRTFTPTKDGEVSNGSQSGWIAWKIYNASPANVSIDMDDEGDGNSLQSCYIQMAN